MSPISAMRGTSSNYVVLRFPTWLFFGSIGCIHIVFATVDNPYGGYPEWLDGLSSGQSVPFAIWLALGTGRFAPRAQVTALMFALVLAGRSIIVQPMETLSAEGIGDQIATFIIIALCLALVRWRKGWRIARDVDVNSEIESTIRFDIKSLLQWTAFFAVLLVIGRFVSPHLDFTQFTDNWSEFFVVWFAKGLMLVVFVLSTLLVLAPTLVNKMAIFTFAIATFTVIGDAKILTFLDMYPQTLIGVSLWVFGGTLAGVLTALPLRLAGYRFSNHHAKPVTL